MPNPEGIKRICQCGNTAFTWYRDANRGDELHCTNCGRLYLLVAVSQYMIDVMEYEDGKI